MIFNVSKNLPDVYSTCALYAQRWLCQQAYDAVAAHASFTCTDKRPDQIAYYIRAQALLHISTSAPECKLTVLKVPWYKKAIYRNTIAQHSYGTIAFNPKFLKRDHADVVNTIVHEYMHYIGFSHNGNSPTEENLASVPYSVGAMAEAFFRGDVI